MNNTLSAKKLTVTALLMALCTISTMIITIPTPIGGYVNCGDVFVILSGFLLGPVYGGIAAGIGSCMADIFAGYALYAPATLIIKFLMAFAVGHICSSKNNQHPFLILGLGGFIAEIIMIVGYFIFSSVFLGLGFLALGEVIGNVIQGAFGLSVSLLVYSLINKSKISLMIRSIT